MINGFIINLVPQGLMVNCSISNKDISKIPHLITQPQIRAPFYIKVSERSEPMREDIMYVTSSLIGSDLAHLNGLMQDCSISSANALEILQS